jgi:hypothetical protein
VIFAVRGYVVVVVAVERLKQNLPIGFQHRAISLKFRQVIQDAPTAFRRRLDQALDSSLEMFTKTDSALNKKNTVGKAIFRVQTACFFSMARKFICSTRCLRPHPRRAVPGQHHLVNSRFARRACSGIQPVDRVDITR